MSDEPLELDRHRGRAAQQAINIRRALAEVENNARDLRDRQRVLKNQLLSVPAASWQDAAAKARYLLNLYAAALAPTPIIAIWSRPYLRILPGYPTTAERICCSRMDGNILRSMKVELRALQSLPASISW